MADKNPTFENKKYVPPWREPYIIGIAGSSGSGKTSIASSIINIINAPWTVLLSMDNFYKALTKEQQALAHASKWDFDSPNSIDMDLAYSVLKSIKEGKKTEIPTYSFNEHARTDKWLTLYGANVVILEGIYALYDERVLSLMDLKVFVDTDLDICLARRLSRDIMSRGRQLNLSIAQWQRYVKPNYEKYIVHTMDNADVLVPRGLDNVIAINMLANHVMKQLLGKSQQHMSHLAKLDAAAFDKELPPEVVVLEQKSQVIGIHTLLKDHMTSRDDFIFYFNRIAGMLINRALDLFDIYCPKEIETPAGHKFSGVNLSFDNICAVNIIRGGECFNVALKRAIPTIRLGKILIQSDSRTGEPRLHTLRLPPRLSPKPAGPDGRVPSAALEELADTRVVLLDLQISSGAAATMATAVLLDHGVREEDIVLVVYAATRNGLRRVTQAFPRVHIVAGRVDERPLKRFMDSKYYGT